MNSAESTFCNILLHDACCFIPMWLPYLNFESLFFYLIFTLAFLFCQAIKQILKIIQVTRLYFFALIYFLCPGIFHIHFDLLYFLNLKYLTGPDTSNSTEDSSFISRLFKYRKFQTMNNLLKLKIKYTFILFFLLPALSAQPEFNNGLATQSVINLRLAPAFAAEMGTQVLMGTPVRILETVHGWSNIVTPEGYKAWTTEESVLQMSSAGYAAWKAAPKVIINTYFTLVRSSPSVNAEVVSDVVWGDILRYQGTTGKYAKVMLPDGREGYLLKQSTLPFKKWLARAKPTAARILSTAKLFIGFPYLWGGTSIKGMDCSGLTKTCFYLNGVVLPRDASQQALTGENVDISNDLSSLRPADLLFFGSMKENKQHVSHVGIYIGNGEFIHSSGTVHISSLLPGSMNFDAYNLKRLIRAQRLLTRIDLDSYIVSIKHHPYYR